MKIGIISLQPPHESFGGATHLNDFCAYLIKLNYKVSLISFEEDFVSFKKKKIIKSDLIKQGFSSVNIISPSQIKKKLKFKVLDFLYEYYLQYNFFKINSKKLEKAVNESDCDFYIVYADAINFCLFNFKKKMIGWISHDGYPFYKISNLLLENRKFYYFLINKIDKYFYIFLKKSIINRFDILFTAPKFWALNWRKRLKKKKIICVSHPTKHCTINIRTIKSSLNKNNEINVLILGSPNVGLTAANLLFLEKEILPIVKLKKLKKIKFKVAGLIIEESNLIKRLKERVIFLNYVEDLKKLICESDMVLLANPFKPNSGSKIATICSMYGCILAHKNLVQSHNEMRNNFNCLTATSGEDFVKKMIYLKKNSKFRYKLMMNARKTYEKFYTFERFTNTIIKNCLKKVS